MDWLKRIGRAAHKGVRGEIGMLGTQQLASLAPEYGVCLHAIVDDLVALATDLLRYIRQLVNEV